MIDLNAEIKRQEKKLEKLTSEKNSLLGRLNNEKFTSKAPKEVIEQSRARVEEITHQEDSIQELINNLK